MKNKLYLLLRSSGFSLVLFYSSSRLLIVHYLITKLINTSFPLLNLFLLNLILNRLTSERNEQIFALVGGLVISIIGSRIFDSIETSIYKILYDKAEHQYELQISEKLTTLPLSFLDTSKGKDVIEDVRYTKQMVCMFPFQLVNMIALIFSSTVAFLTLINFSVGLTALFLMLTIPGIILSHITMLRNDKWRMETAPDVRRFSYYRWMLTDIWPAKDVRMYDLTEPLKTRYVEEKQEYLAQKIKLDKKQLIDSLYVEVIKQSGIILFIIFVTMSTFKNNISIGQFALYTGMVISASNSVQEFSYFFVEVFTIFIQKVNKVFEFQNLVFPEDEKAKKEKKSLGDFESLVFDNVYFKYPGSENYILSGVSFTLKKGDKLSIIGINGSGKSTIVKLILGLYKIDSGEILINGCLIEDYSIKEVRRLFSALFQVFVAYPLTLRENIALSDISKFDEDEEILKAIEKSGFSEKFETLHSNIESYMTRQFDDNGIELSKGQWQKIALSRVYFKNAQVVILDEPSAALDPEAEDRIFNNFETISNGKTGVLISHRISSAKISNKVIVLNEGKIIEYGTHETLLCENGLYAKLFNLQMEKYSLKEG